MLLFIKWYCPSLEFFRKFFEQSEVQGENRFYKLIKKWKTLAWENKFKTLTSILFMPIFAIWNIYKFIGSKSIDEKFYFRLVEGFFRFLFNGRLILCFLYLYRLKLDPKKSKNIAFHYTTNLYRYSKHCCRNMRIKLKASQVP